MSTSCTTYVMIGALLDYKTVKAIMERHGGDAHDKLEPLIEIAEEGQLGSFGCIFDGMCGKYIALGKVVKRAAKDQWFDEPVAVEPITPTDVGYLAEAIRVLVPDIVFKIQTLVICHYH